jgi:hypothetical protein
LCELTAQSVGRDEVRERLLAVDLDDWNQLAITRLERRVAIDDDFLQLEAKLHPKLAHSRPRPLAEVAALGAVEADYG